MAGHGRDGEPSWVFLGRIACLEHLRGAGFLVGCGGNPGSPSCDGTARPKSAELREYGIGVHHDIIRRRPLPVERRGAHVTRANHLEDRRLEKRGEPRRFDGWSWPLGRCNVIPPVSGATTRRQQQGRCAEENPKARAMSESAVRTMCRLSWYRHDLDPPYPQDRPSRVGVDHKSAVQLRNVCRLRQCAVPPMCETPSGLTKNPTRHRYPRKARSKSARSKVAGFLDFELSPVSFRVGWHSSSRACKGGTGHVVLACGSVPSRCFGFARAEARHGASDSGAESVSPAWTCRPLT